MKPRALALALIVLAPASLARAQTLETCAADWLDVERLQAILEIELAEHRGPVLDGTHVVVTGCELDEPTVTLSAPGSEPSTMTLRVGNVAPRARTRFVALVVAELLRTRTPVVAAVPAAAPDAPALEDPSPAPEAPPPELLVVTGTVQATVGVATAPTPAPAPPSAALGSPYTPLADPPEPPPAAAARPSPWRMGVGAGATFFFSDAVVVTPAAMGEITLRYDRLWLGVGGGGTQFDSFAGTFRLGQVSGGIGVRIAEYVGRVRIGWDLRGEGGAAFAVGEPSNVAFVGNATTTWLLRATTGVELAWRVGDAELGFFTAIGYQRGVVENGPFFTGGLGGLLAGITMEVTWAL